MKKSIIITIIAVLIFVFTFKIIIFDNVNFLYSILEGLNTKSPLYNFTIERIYKIAEKKDIGKNLIAYIEKDENQNLHDLYIRILGVIGEYDAINCLLKTYIKYQDDKNRLFTIYKIISSLGFLGNEEIVPFLESILNKNSWPLLNHTIARSLYLITGKPYVYMDHTGKSQELYLYDGLIQARKVVLSTRGKKRSFDNMLILDKLLRPVSKSDLDSGRFSR